MWSLLSWATLWQTANAVGFRIYMAQQVARLARHAPLDIARAVCVSLNFCNLDRNQTLALFFSVAKIIQIRSYHDYMIISCKNEIGQRINVMATKNPQCLFSNEGLV